MKVSYRDPLKCFTVPVFRTLLITTSLHARTHTYMRNNQNYSCILCSSNICGNRRINNVIGLHSELEVLCKGHSGSHSLHFVMARRQGIMNIEGGK